MGEDELKEALTHLSTTIRGTDDPHIRARLLEQADEYLDLLSPTLALA